MNNKNYFWLLMTILTMVLTVPSATSAQERRRDDERRDEYREKGRGEERREENRGDRREGRGNLAGRWYKDGHPCEIVSTRDGFEARNERGGTSRLVYDRDGVRALDWEGGLRGEIRGNRIDWANGTSWTR